MEWQPIETAPRDGSEIIAFGIRGGDYGYTSDEKAWTGVSWSNSLKLWIETKAAPRYSNGFKPTHWIPLPLPPKDAHATE